MADRDCNEKKKMETQSDKWFENASTTARETATALDTAASAIVVTDHLGVVEEHDDDDDTGQAEMEVEQQVDI